MTVIIEGDTILQEHKGRSDYFGQGGGGLEIEVFRGTSKLSPEREVHLAEKWPELQVEGTAGA